MQLLTVVVVGIIAPQIHGQACVLENVPIDIARQRRGLCTSDVAVRGVADELAHRILHALDSVVLHERRNARNIVVREAVAHGATNGELCRKIAVRKLHVMVLLTHQIRVALLQRFGVSLVEIRIERPDARSVYAHIVAESHTVLVVYAVAHACRRHHIIEPRREVFALA